MLNHLNRSFALRIVFGTIGVAALFSLILSLFTIFQAYREVIRFGTQEIRQVGKNISGVARNEQLTRTSARRTLRGHVENAKGRHKNRIYALALIAVDNSVFAISDKNTSPMSKLLLRKIHSKIGGGRHSTEFFWRAGQLYIRVLAPIRTQTSGPRMIAGLVGISPASLQRLFRDVRGLVLKIIIGSMLMGLATAQILYPILAEQQRRIFNFAIELMNGNIESLKLLGNAIAKRDSDTNAHNFRVTIFSIRLAEVLKLSDIAIQELIKGAFLHDVGKIGIPDGIHLKEGPLDPRERREMNRHVEYGTEIIAASAWLSGAVDVVRHHHEKFDGNGYPDKLRGDNIPINARIFAIVDVFDALTSKRPYKKPFTYERTWEILDDGSGSHFDPDVLESFRNIAPTLYSNVSRMEEQELDKHLEDLIYQYFRP